MEIPVANHLKPANIFNSGVRIELDLSAGIPQRLFFRQIEIDGNPFVPTGVFTTQPVNITIEELAGYTFNVGPDNGVNFPAPLNQNMIVNGNLPTTLVFVDFVIVKQAIGLLPPPPPPEI